MTERHLSWGADFLWRQLEPLLPGLSVEIVARIESTNSELIERARRDAGSRAGPPTRPGEIDPLRPTPLGRRSADTQPCLLVAEHQTRGRGRLGRDWVASAGASLTFSLSLSFEPAAWSGMSLAVGVALANALEAPRDGVVSRMGLKWPNDLWLRDEGGGGRKLGGVLIETVAVGERRMAVVGVGLNVHAQGAESLAGLTSGYASLDELDPLVSAPAALARVAMPLVQALRRFEVEGFAAFADGYRARDLLRGKLVTTTSEACPRGVADGVDDDSGALRVRVDDHVYLLSSGEVSVRPAAGAPTLPT